MVAPLSWVAQKEGLVVRRVRAQIELLEGCGNAETRLAEGSVRRLELGRLAEDIEELERRLHEVKRLCPGLEPPALSSFVERARALLFQWGVRAPHARRRPPLEGEA